MMDRMRDRMRADMLGSVGMRPKLGLWRTGWKVVRRCGIQYAKWDHVPYRFELRTVEEVIAQNIEEEEKIPWPEREYISAFGCAGRGRVGYWFERPTVPDKLNGPLAVFKSLATATEFIRRSTPTAVAIRCLYKRSTEHHCWVIDGIGRAVLDCKHVPEGTDFADVVVLLRGENLLTCEVMR